MDSLTIVIIVASIAIVMVSAIAFAVGYQIGLKRAPKPDPLEATSFKEELLDLRHIKEQLDNPPERHEHIWARKPDVHKMGWLRYRCTYKGCSALEWVAEKVPPA
jgi:hypothetical protein